MAFLSPTSDDRLFVPLYTSRAPRPLCALSPQFLESFREVFLIDLFLILFLILILIQELLLKIF